MGRNSGEIKYAAGTATSKVGLVNMYLHGGVILSAIALFLGLARAGSVNEAIQVWWEFYMMRVLLWPLDQVLTTEGLVGLAFSHALTIGVGLVSATSKWWIRVQSAEMSSVYKLVDLERF